MLVVGVITANLTPAGSTVYCNLATAKGFLVYLYGIQIPIHLIRKLIRVNINVCEQIIMDLIDLGYVSGRPYLGISMQNISIRTTSNSGNNGSFFPFGSYGSYGYVNRVQVVGIEEGSAAEQAGMQVNDIIISLGSTEINGSSDLSTLLYEYKVGDTVTITVQRGTELLDLSVTLGERTKA